MRKSYGEDIYYHNWNKGGKSQNWGMFLKILQNKADAYEEDLLRRCPKC